MTLFVKLFSTRTLVRIVVALTAIVAMKALSVHYDFQLGNRFGGWMRRTKEAAN
jgi:hypothetical protein